MSTATNVDAPRETLLTAPVAASRRIASLDGLRALSISLVVFGHAANTTGFPSWLRPFADSTRLGVRVFFVISGFLITTLLLREHERTGRISLAEFYKRRAFRILPAATVTIAVISVIWRPGWVSTVAALCFVRNYFIGDWYLGHFWSLSTEEQFYFLWPLLLVRFFPARRRLAIAGIVIAPFARLIGDRISPSTSLGFTSMEDALATGCLLAMMQPELVRWRPWIDRLILPITAAALVMLGLKYPPGVQPLIVFTIVNFAIACIIDHCIRRKYWLLNWGPVVWLGVLSYSLYLWQQPFMVENSLRWYATWPLNIVLALAAAIVCHYGIERPFLNLRKKSERAIP
jgi:peptidoglycan/LPS O-acetylase OafA/YrhL